MANENGANSPGDSSQPAGRSSSKRKAVSDQAKNGSEEVTESSTGCNGIPNGAVSNETEANGVENGSTHLRKREKRRLSLVDDYIVASPSSLTAPQSPIEPPSKRPRQGSSGVPEVLKDVVEETEDDLDFVRRRRQPRARRREPPMRMMMILFPNDPEKKRALPRKAILDTAAPSSFTYKSVLEAANIPFYYHSVGTRYEGLTGKPQSPIGTLPLVWQACGKDGKDEVYNTTFIVLGDDDFDAKADFIIGWDWLCEVGYELSLRRDSEDDTGARRSLPMTSNNTVYFAAETSRFPSHWPTS